MHLHVVINFRGEDVFKKLYQGTVLRFEFRRFREK